MVEICKKCGLPKDLCVCDTLAREETRKIKIYSTSKKFRKLVTVIEGIEKAKVGEVAKKLKHALACGGTAKEGTVVLQGEHMKKVKELLVKMGYPENIIEITGRL